MKVLANPDVQSAASLDVIIGAQIGQFSGQSLFDAFNSEWALDSRADRMGMRLLGTPLQYQGPSLISEGIPLGAIRCHRMGSRLCCSMTGRPSVVIRGWAR